MIFLAAILVALAGMAHDRRLKRRAQEHALQHGIRMYAMGAHDALDELDGPAIIAQRDFYLDQVNAAREGRQ